MIYWRQDKFRHIYCLNDPRVLKDTMKLHLFDDRTCRLLKRFNIILS